MSAIEQQIEGIVDNILEDYRHGRDIDKLNPFVHPDKETVTDIIRKLLRICYPGSSRDKSYRMYNSRYNLSMLIEDVMYNLNKQIAIVLGLQMEEAEAEERAQLLSLEFFRQLPAVRAMCQTDVEAFYDGDPAAYSTDEIIFCYPGLFAITVYRMAHVLYTLGVPMLPRMMTEYAHSLTGIDIHPGATIGPYFFIDHGTGVVIGETTVIGERVKLYQGVTLGAKSFAVQSDGTLVKGNKRHPNIGSNVVIYAGATILGGDTYIGDNCVIGGNVWLTHSVEPGKRVLTAREQTEFVTTDI